eukprot:CAMPEP_0202892336 /NCGR_PEP_ID=MMETSP1392-20130828/2055_1 /ASSEMBLY_ACC=CAM_ASM_000868 /TAXON_ID=225041 /ORGANISM="Chlamydomonas chlamydogama, Strain SAG 11-48b" /LENGTH=397 /DNA_ID=CAMNT_0049576233 /DNA_START=195 /DNA_END=1388 /DNA_ORIENTATION=-
MAVQAAEDYLLDPSSTQEIMDFIDKNICPAIGDSTKCHNLAQGLLPVILQWLKATATPATLCSDAGVCGSAVSQFTTPVNKPALLLPRDSVTCGMCKYVVGKAQAALNDTSVQDSIKNKALEVCGTLPKELADGCTDFVNTYEPAIASFIEKADVDEVCMLIGACMEGFIARVGAPAALPERAALLLKALADVGGLKARRPQPLGGMLGDSCDVCKMAVIEAHSLITNPSVQADLLNYTKALCDTVGATFADACKAYVDDYAPAMFDLLAKYLTPDELCVNLGICATPRIVRCKDLGNAASEAKPQQQPQQAVGYAGSAMQSLRAATTLTQQAVAATAAKYSSSVFRSWFGSEARPQPQQVVGYAGKGDSHLHVASREVRRARQMLEARLRGPGATR